MMPELLAIFTWPSALGSGKLATPWPRMHCENARASDRRDAVCAYPPDEPHAATNTATTARANGADTFEPRGEIRWCTPSDVDEQRSNMGLILNPMEAADQPESRNLAGYG